MSKKIKIYTDHTGREYTEYFQEEYDKMAMDPFLNILKEEIQKEINNEIINTLFKIDTEEQYNKALSRLEEIWGADEESSEFIELNHLADAIVEYENEHYPIEKPTEEEVRKFYKDQNKPNSN